MHDAENTTLPDYLDETTEPRPGEAARRATFLQLLRERHMGVPGVTQVVAADPPAPPFRGAAEALLAHVHLQGGATAEAALHAVNAIDEGASELLTQLVDQPQVFDLLDSASQAALVEACLGPLGTYGRPTALDVAHNLAGRGNGELAFHVLALSSAKPNIDERRSWLAIREQFETQERSFKEFQNILDERVQFVASGAKQAVDQATQKAKAHVATFEKSIASRVATVDERISHADKALGQLEKHTQEAAKGHLIDAYGKSARASYRRFQLWTALSLVIGLAAIVVAFLGFGGDVAGLSTSEVVARTIKAVALFVLAGALNRLAAHERRDYRSARHMELQLSTAPAFLRGFDPVLRGPAEAALALRFFPGQLADPFGSGAHSGDTAGDPYVALEQIARRVVTESSTKGASGSGS